MNSPVVLLEDSGKVKMGGGQRISIEVVASLPEISWVVFDADRYSEFLNRLRLSCPGVKVETYPVSRSFSTFSSASESDWGRLVLELLYSVKSFFVLRNKILILPPCTLYATSKKMAIFAMLLRLTCSNVRRVVIHQHSAILRTSQRALWTHLCRKFVDRVIYPSSFVQSSFSLPPEQCTIVENFVDDRFFKIDEYLDLPDQPKIGFFGTLLPWKGVYLLDRIADLLHSRAPGAQVEVYGEDPENLASKFCHAHYKGVADTASVLPKISVVLIPSLAPEAFCLVAAEALVAGRSIVTTMEGALPDTCSPNGHDRIALSYPYTPERFVDAVIVALKAIQEKQGCNVRTERFRRDRFIQEIRRIFV